MNIGRNRRSRGTMNKILEKFARDYIRENLKKCTKAQQDLFTAMYRYDIHMNLDSVIDSMTVSKLDWAMQQVERTVAKNEAGKADGKGSA
jgi:hypothetical protein